MGCNDTGAIAFAGDACTGEIEHACCGDDPPTIEMGQNRHRMFWLLSLTKRPGLPGTAGFGGGSSQAVDPPGGNNPARKNATVASTGGGPINEH